MCKCEVICEDTAQSSLSLSLSLSFQSGIISTKEQDGCPELGTAIWPRTHPTTTREHQVMSPSTLSVHSHTSHHSHLYSELVNNSEIHCKIVQVLMVKQHWVAPVEGIHNTHKLIQSVFAQLLHVRVYIHVCLFVACL